MNLDATKIQFVLMTYSIKRI